MSKKKNNVEELTHVAGTFLIHVPGAFLNGAGLGAGEDRTVTIPKTLRFAGNFVPYVSSQAWRRWLRNTLIEETGWDPSTIRAIAKNAKGNTSKIAGELNPIDFPEDDLFGYMFAKGKASKSKSDLEDEEDEGEEESTIEKLKLPTHAITRTSPFMSSILMAIQLKDTVSKDDGFVHLNEGTPLPYSTKFYTADLVAFFALDVSRVGKFVNIGDKLEIDPDWASEWVKSNKINVKTAEKSLQVWELSDSSARNERIIALLKALAVLRGGAKQAQFGADVSPKIIITAGLRCGNPIFNDLFKAGVTKPILKIETLKQIIIDYKDRIVTDVYLGMRTDFLENDDEVSALNDLQIGNTEIKIKIYSPLDAITKFCTHVK